MPFTMDGLPIRLRPSVTAHDSLLTQVLGNRNMDKTEFNWQVSTLMNKALGRMMHFHLARAVTKWQEWYEQHTQMLFKMKGAVTRMMKRQLAMAWEKWQQWYTEAKVQQRLMSGALCRFMNRKLSMAWEKWQFEYEELMRQQQLLRRAIQRMRMAKLAAAFGSWRLACAFNPYSSGEGRGNAFSSSRGLDGSSSRKRGHDGWTSVLNAAEVRRAMDGTCDSKAALQARNATRRTSSYLDDRTKALARYKKNGGLRL